MPFHTRQMADLLQPQDPLATFAHLPEIAVVIPCHSKDVETLGLVVAGVKSYSRNPIGKVHLVAPSGMVADLRSWFPKADVESEEDVLGDRLLGLLEKKVPHNRRGWATQQLIKFAAAIQSEGDGCLIIDADTVLLRERTWLTSDGVQALCISHEYHEPYAAHAERMWGPRARSTGYSYVTHHQLMQNDILREMFSDVEGGLYRWLEMADSTEMSGMSEYHCYGTWIARNDTLRVRYAKWGNRHSLRPQSLLESTDVLTALGMLRSRFPDAYSVSFHSYLAP
jgi:hypothetical protein